MKKNISTRLIHDESVGKVYLSIEGKVEDCTSEEREQLKDTLVEAFSLVLGLAKKPAIETIKDFENVEQELPDFIKKGTPPAGAATEPKDATGDVPTVGTKPETETKTKPEAEVEAKPETKTETMTDPEPVMGYGRYKDKTARQIMEELGSEGIAVLNKFAESLQKNVARFPANQERIDSIQKVLKEFEVPKEASEEKKETEEPKQDGALSFDDIISDIERCSVQNGDEDLKTVETICTPFGMSFADLIKSRDEDKLTRVYGMFKDMLKACGM